VLPLFRSREDNTMHCDKQVWCMAVAVLSSEREHAGSYAAQRAKDALEHDDTQGHERWVSVMKAMVEWLRRPDEDDTVH
jgi:hypothetical protein